MATHYLVVDRDDRSILAWFPKADDDQRAFDDACDLAYDSGNLVGDGVWTGSAFEVTEVFET